MLKLRCQSSSAEHQCIQKYDTSDNKGSEEVQTDEKIGGRLVGCEGGRLMPVATSVEINQKMLTKWVKKTY